VAIREVKLCFWFSLGALWRRASAYRAENKSRVGKGRPAGSNELRVSPSPSKIPYGGFSPVRLQMDRQWRPSTKSRDLSAVHIRPMIPSYTPPQLQLPGIRDPRRDFPFENLSVQCGTTPNNWNTSIQRPLTRHRVMLSRRVIAYYGLMRPSESLPATYEFAARAAAPKEIGLRWESRGSPIYSAGLGSRAASLTPVARWVQMTISSPSVLAFAAWLPVRRPHWTFRGCRVRSELIPRAHATARELASPPFEDVYIRACADEVTLNQRRI